MEGNTIPAAPLHPPPPFQESSHFGFRRYVDRPSIVVIEDGTGGAVFSLQSFSLGRNEVYTYDQFNHGRHKLYVGHCPGVTVINQHDAGLARFRINFTLPSIHDYFDWTFARGAQRFAFEVEDTCERFVTHQFTLTGPRIAADFKLYGIPARWLECDPINRGLEAVFVLQLNPVVRHNRQTSTSGWVTIADAWASRRIFYAGTGIRKFDEVASLSFTREGHGLLGRLSAGNGADEGLPSYKTAVSQDSNMMLALGVFWVMLMGDLFNGEGRLEAVLKRRNTHEKNWVGN
ncbi:hypothetical protein BC830DRAFT_64079 [Chytriomyces sp. MP71]|nr:hypothetical protein BC830DRAFT_64079 [Chytriomyces sp. MP71]